MQRRNASRRSSGEWDARCVRGPRPAWFARFLLGTGLLGVFAVAGPGRAATPLGFLQFEVEHDLETPACLTTGTCALHFENYADPSALLARLRPISELAVLHWDRAIPWLAFDPDPPVGVDPIAYYDGRLDSETVAYLDAFAAHFSAMETGYLAVSILSGERDRLAALRIGPGADVAFPAACPAFAPGTQVVVDAGSGPQAFDLLRSYRNFVLHLARKLGPDHLALLVEANLIESTCPQRASELYALYRALHDEVQIALSPNAPTLFATLSLPLLLDYDRDACHPTAAFTACEVPPAPPAPATSEALCFPTNPSAIDALALGGRLDVLALSFYPDALEMQAAPAETSSLRAFPLAGWNAGGACSAMRSFGQRVDPIAAIDRLGWSGPVAIAEIGARSCASPLYVDVPGPGGASPWVFEVPGSPASQAAWIGETHRAAVERGFLFYAHSFLRDYRPIGPWIAEQGILSPELQALLNLWPCSGLQHPDGTWKSEMLAIGLPEPAGGPAFAAALVGLRILARRRAGRGFENRRKFPMARTEETGYIASVGSTTRSRPVDAKSE